MPGIVQRNATTTKRRQGRRGRRRDVIVGPKTSLGRSSGRYIEDAASIAKRSMNAVMALRRLINVETKFVDNTFTQLTTDYNGTVNYLTNVAQGTDVSNRVGDSIKIQRIDVTGAYTRNGTDAIARVIIFRDTENAAATPAVADVLAQTGSVLAPHSAPTWLNKNLNAEKNRFVFLYDEVVCLSTSQSNMLFEYRSPNAQDKHVRFRGTGSTTASAGEGAIFMLRITDQVTSNLPQLTAVVRIHYTDD